MVGRGTPALAGEARRSKLIARFELGGPAQAPAATAPAPRAHAPVAAMKTTGRGGAAPKPHAEPEADAWDEF